MTSEGEKAVPDFQAWFLPLLRRICDGDSHEISTLYQQWADDMGLSSDDRAEMLPFGKQFTCRNRIGWARTYLRKAGLLESPGRGEVQITSRGRAVLENPPEKLNVRYLKRFPSFEEFHAPSQPIGEGVGVRIHQDLITRSKLFARWRYGNRPPPPSCRGTPGRSPNSARRTWGIHWSRCRECDGTVIS